MAPGAFRTPVTTPGAAYNFLNDALETGGTAAIAR